MTDENGDAKPIGEMTVRQIVEKHLKDGGFDGLCFAQEGATCGCGLDDLAPCGGYSWDCEPGFAGPPTSADEEYILYFPTREAAEKAKSEATEENNDD